MTTTLAVTLLVAAIYLFAVRFIDFNEKEPLWAVLMLFGSGLVAAVVLLVGANVAGATFLELNPIAGALTTELVRFLALSVGFGALVAIGNKRGYSEVNGLMDGVVYGSAGGFGFATGLSFTREILMPTEATLMGAGSAAAGYGEMALMGVSDGVFGAIVGVGFAAAIEAKKPIMRTAGPLGGLIAAVLGHLAYDYIAHGNPFSDSAVARKWIGLALPLVAVALITIIALRGENKAIAEELTAEAETGACTPDELKVLQSLFSREALYFKRLFKFDFGGWNMLHSLHNRQVQLALAKRRVSEETDDEQRKANAGEVAHLRVAVFELKKALGLEAPAAPAAPGGES
jgi:hypothetical protein